MLIRTHIAITMLAVLLFLPQISNKMLFMGIALLATVLPDADTGFSTIGKSRVFKVLQFFTKHRGVVHSFSLCILISIVLAIFYPVLSLAFFLGYALHLFADSFTIEGITPFWPYSRMSHWRVRTGGRIESTILLFFASIDVLIIILYLVNL